ncbi:30S ribosomal protein THX [Spirosoma rigui]|nr:30S ribosomal protein THX [Spirosoma rigui]
MGRGDIKTRRGKISVGSHGNTRPRVTSKSTAPKAPAAVTAPAEDKA